MNIIEAGKVEQRLRGRVQVLPSDHAAWHELGLAAFNRGDLALAIQCLEAAVAVNGKVALYQRNLGEICRRAGLLEKAEAAGRRAVKLAPSDIDAHYNLGLAYTDARNYRKAVACYRQALKLNPRHNLSWNNLGSALEQEGDKDQALAAYEKAIAIDPRHAEAQNNAGAIYSEQGRLAQARTAFQAAIDARPDFVEAHYNLSSLKKYTRDDPHLAMLERIYAARDKLSDHARIRYCFALGKALDDIGEFDRAFAAYDEGNRLQHKALPMDEARADAMLDEILRVFDEKFFSERADWQGAADSRRTPIFIVGMPRSGTTLLEQILCSHPSVHGAGELIDLNAVITQATAASAGQPFTAGVVHLTEAELCKLGETYLKRVWKLSPESAFITDKMPANFFYLGLIHLALPHAKIIHAMRDPMDSCFSCFSRLFNDTMEFAYDQGTLGRYYARYIRLMQHWHKVLPAGTILDLPYELMVEDTEGQARRVLEFVGLPWDRACLEFHKNERLVKTASVAQVRKPIYKSSVARWRHFSRHLRPLYELVKPYRAADDADQLFANLPPAPVTQGSVQTAEQFHQAGIALYRQDRFAEAIAHYDRALALQPDFAACLNSKGFALQDMDRMPEALACFARAVELAPEMAMARLNLAMAQLKLGDFEQGWENYEARWTGSAEANAGKLSSPKLSLPQWRGETGTQKQGILIVTEQGFGDTFQFGRYLPLLTQRFGKVGFLCSAPTLRVLEWSFGNQIALFTTIPRDTDTWHWQCPLMSLPLAFGTRLESVPAEMPYLKVSKPARKHWAERLAAAAPGRLRVGIAWAGRKEHQYNARRSLTLRQIEPFLRDPRVTWVSLQKWALDEFPPEVPLGIDWLDWTADLGDFADTAALIANLDLVISVGSVNVHLAGGLNVPVWMLDHFDNEWRWLNHREDNPWYPNLRIFRQRAFGEWAPVIERVRVALAELPAPRKIRPASARGCAPRQMPLVNDALPRQALPARTVASLPEAHRLHQQGIAAWQVGQAAEALRLIEQAIVQDANVALFHSNLTEMYRQQGQIDVAIQHGEAAVALDPAMASAHGNLGIAYYDAQRHDEAEACHHKALALEPRLLQSLNNLGSIARARKDLKVAADWYRRALAINEDFLESLSNLGAVLVEDDQADAAEPFLLRALQLQSAYPEALCNLGLVRLKQDRADEAIAWLSRALQLRPGYPEALVGLGRSLHEQDRLEESAKVLLEATRRAPEKTDAWSHLGAVRMEMGETTAAEEAYARALEIDPQCTDALAGLGNLRLEEGQIDGSVKLLEQVLTIDPDHLGARFHLAQARKVMPGDANLAVLEACAADLPALSADRRISLHYALGKAYDDLKAWDKAFPHFLEGARLKRARLSYDPALDAARTSRIAEVVDAAFIKRFAGAGNDSTVPVFVLGMPRSGTTLTEQIIASHPEVFGAGELRDLMTVVQTPGPGGQQLPFPENLSDVSAKTLRAWGDDYLARLQARAPDARRITDKMPANYLALGLIPLMLPKARIIHVKRNPVDTCVSCFTRLFNRHQEATYDLYELGRHYANYARLMDHWRQVLPAGSFLEVQYEDIVADMEGQARRLIDWVGLDWHPACLDFHKTKRNIRTASVTQVRQPIYTSSVERWRNYEAYLGPLLEGLGG